MTIGSPRRCFSASRGSVMGRREASLGTRIWAGMLDMCAPYLRLGLTPSAEEGRHRRVDVDDAVRTLLDVDDPGLVALHVGPVVLRVGDDDDGVAAVDEAGSGAVDLHLAGAPLAGDRVRLEAGAVVDVHDVD